LFADGTKLTLGAPQDAVVQCLAPVIEMKSTRNVPRNLRLNLIRLHALWQGFSLLFGVRNEFINNAWPSTILFPET